MDEAYFAQVEQMQRRAEEDSRLIEEHRKWKREFESGLPTTSEKKQDNEHNREETTT